MSEQVKRYAVTVVTERLEVSGTSDELATAARIHAPHADGWRFVMSSIVDGVCVERYERETARMVVEVGVE